MPQANSQCTRTSSTAPRLTLLEVALRHLDLGHGFRVFPLADKVPVIKGGHTAATHDVAQVRAWWRFRPDANVGLRVPENIVVLDVDGPPGRTALAGKVMPPTVTVATPREGGFHHYFSTKKRLRSRIGFLPGVDAKAGPDSYVVAAGSWSERYQRQWRGVPGLRWGKVAVAPAPDWLIAALLPRPVTTVATCSLPASAGSRYATAALEREASLVATTPEGRRNAQLDKSAFALGQLVGAGHLEDADVSRVLLSAAVTSGLLDDEAKKTIRSGLEAGRCNRRVIRHG